MPILCYRTKLVRLVRGIFEGRRLKIVIVGGIAKDTGRAIIKVEIEIQAYVRLSEKKTL